MVVVAVAAIIVVAVLSGSRKRIRSKLNEEYGGNLSKNDISKNSEKQY